MKYKVGDKVRIKSLDWYKENRNNINEVKCGVSVFIPAMTTHCGHIRTISKVFEIPKVYHILEDKNLYTWTDEMIEGLVEGLTDEEFMEEWAKVDINQLFNDAMVKNMKKGCNAELSCPEGYEFRDENGNVINAQKIVLEKKKPKYPKTIEECCKILGLEFNPFYTGVKRQINYKDGLLHNLKCLLIYRDAYWKIAGEEMGLGKPWEPDWNNISDKYCIYFVSGDAWSKECQTRQCPFAFPTREMRDAFKENFDQDIENCKELL